MKGKVGKRLEVQRLFSSLFEWGRQAINIEGDGTPAQWKRRRYNLVDITVDRFWL